MVDREARDKAAVVLRKFMVECSITNREYEDTYPVSKADPAVLGIYQQIWYLYDDMREHLMLGEYSLLTEHKKVVDRCLLFLQSDLEYLWPPLKWDLFGLFFDMIRYAISLGNFRPRQRKLSYNEENFWPFFDHDQIRQSARS